MSQLRRPDTAYATSDTLGNPFVGDSVYVVVGRLRRSKSSKVAVQAGDGLDPRQDPRPHGPPLRKAAAGVGGRGPQPCAAGLGQLLPLRQLRQKFDHIDAYVNERLALLASAKHGRTG